MTKYKKKKLIPRIELIKRSYVNSSITPSLDLVGVDVAITIEDRVFDKDLENKSSETYKKLEKQVEQEVRKKE